MNTHRVAAACLLAFATPMTAGAQEAPAVPASFEVVRLADGQMTCEALVAEINGLNGRMNDLTSRMTGAATEMSRNALQQARGMGGGASTALSLGGLAAAMIPGAGLALGAAQALAGAAQQAQMASQQDRMYDQMDAMTAQVGEATALMGPISQRIDHLGEIARGKGC